MSTMTSSTVAPATTARPVTPERILQMAWGYAPPLALEAAIRHGIFDQLDSRPMSLTELHNATGCSMRGLSALVNLLVGLDFLSKDEQGNFSLTPESSTFLVSHKPSFQGGMLTHVSQHLMPKWLNLTQAVQTGDPVRAVNQEQEGTEFFQKFVADLFPMNYPIARELAAHLRLDKSSDRVSVLDLAAGSGVWSIALAQSSPHVHVTAVDWPGVLPVTRSITGKLGLADRYTFVQGDLHDADFGSGHHVATLGHILHSEGLQRSKDLLKKTYRALAPGGTIAIAEFLVNADRRGPVNGLIFAINMLINTDDGDTYSFEEIAEWLEEAGFTYPRTLAVHGPSPLILATKQ